MDGLEAVELSWYQVLEENNSFRLDSYFFHKAYLEEDNLRDKFENVILGNIAFITDGQHGYHEVDETSNISHITAKNTKNWFTDNYNCDKLAKWVDEKNQRSSLQENDILLSNRGTVGYCSIVKSNILPANIDQDIARIVLNSNSPIITEYLTTYLNSKFGNDWVIRNMSGMVQQDLPLNKIREIPVPILTTSLQYAIKKLTEASWLFFQQSKQAYEDAEELLLIELNLKDWQPTEDNIAVKSFSSSFFASGRLDAEYYHPKVDQLIQRLEEKVELTALGNLLTVNQRGKQPNYIEDEEAVKNVLPVINSKHVQKREVILTDNRFATVSDSNNTLTIQKNDVLINGTGRGTMGRCAPYLYEEPALPDNHVTILRTDLLDQVYLSIYLNSIAGQFQVEKYLKGSSGQLELYPNDIAQFLVWVAPDSVQQQIRNKVEESHQKREQSKQLLEIAKTGVEKAIETDEATATAWMNQQLTALGINLELG
ncbi:hypothetical protein [Nostoc sp. MS1]|uniref:hypothetical protein n=1 Tax=Nostoc sp. MS1 TaxID=2764711 RepID=UPI001CC6B176|nr:hypothetical protein [Nostoc sp. MS1]BCL35004.1 hypothetical protein NSMS1_14510 [Nostoc sp. MS1]